MYNFDVPGNCFYLVEEYSRITNNRENGGQFCRKVMKKASGKLDGYSSFEYNLLE